MALFDKNWYVNFGDGSTTGYYSVAVWQATHAYTAGTFVRQAAAPAVGSERLFVCIIAGTSLGSEPTWTTTRGAKTAEAAGPTWQECTGMAGPNGDLTNSPTWTTVKNLAVTLGEVIYDSGSSSPQICSTAGTAGNGATPGFSATAGTTTADNTITWTSLGNVSGFTGGQYPHARMMNAAATNWAQVLSGVGANIYVNSASQETQSSAITTPGNASTAAAPFNIICVNGAHYPPQSGDVTTGATIGTTGASNITDTLVAYHYGLTFSAGSAANAASIIAGGTAYGRFDTCTFKLNNTSSSSGIGFAVNAAELNNPQLINCNYIFGSTSQGIIMSGVFNNNSAFQMIGGTIAPSGSVPTTLLTPGVGKSAFMLMRDVDLSAITGTVINLAGGWIGGSLKMQNCKLGSGVSITSSIFNGPFEPNVYLANCDSGATNYRYYYANYGGTVQQETTTVRAGGATDGTTPISWSMASSANTTFPATPFISEEIAQWNSVTGVSKTATIYLATNTTLNNNDFWAEIEYLGSSGSPLGSLVNSRMALLATPAALTTDSGSTWGGSPSNKYSIAISFTPQLKGPVKLRLYLAKPSVTVFIDPYIYIS